MSDCRTAVLDLARRGYHVVYRPEQANYCPGCGGRHWLIGRVSAECAICATALPLAAARLMPRYAPIFTHRLGRDYGPEFALSPAGAGSDKRKLPTWRSMAWGGLGHHQR